MSEAEKETTIFQLADQFIALANEINAKEQDVSKVGTALRFAASRFNAFEAALKSADLAAEKQIALPHVAEALTYRKFHQKYV